MAISCSLLTTGASSVSNTPYVSASITPAANKVVIAQCCMGNSISDNMTISGCNLTWTKINTAYVLGLRITAWWGISSSPTTGSVTFTHLPCNNAAWTIVQLTGASPTTPVEQSVVRVAENLPALTINLATFRSSTNATLCCCGMETTSGVELAPGSGFTMVGQSDSEEHVVGGIEFKDTPDTSVDYSRDSGAGDLYGIAMELNETLASASPSRSPSVSRSKSPSASKSVSPSASPSVVSSFSPSASPSISLSASPSISISRSPSASPSVSISRSPSSSLSASPSVSPSASPSPPAVLGKIVNVKANVKNIKYKLKLKGVKIKSSIK